MTETKSTKTREHGASCAAARCGDGITRADLQAEDPGLRLATTATSITVTPAPTAAPPRVAATRSSMLGWKQCDDGNQIDNDACRNNCEVARCGDGAIGPGEECDDGNADDNDACRNNCDGGRCGDGLIQAGETCDDANRIDNDACRNTCQVAACGDGVRRNDLAEDCAGL